MQREGGVVKADVSDSKPPPEFHGQSLDHWCGAPMPVECFLPLAIAITDALAEVHRQQIIHKNIKPQNLVVDTQTGRVQVVDFSVATKVPRQYPTAGNPRHLEGSLAYMAPEQMGRMNRVLDYRADFYALGAVFYELLTGQVPFQSDDPMELVHSHIAAMPRPPSERVPTIPQTLANIVLKLLAKAPEDRYQSTGGLKHDLERSLTQWTATRKVTPFALGEHDPAAVLRIPQRLYGRQTETETLLHNFERVAETGVPEWMLVSGYSGVGKSSLIHELHKPIVRARGWFVAGKFDQHSRDVPFSAFARALEQLVFDILAEPEDQLIGWKQRLLTALGHNAQLIIEVIPALELILGPQPTMAELPLSEAQNRFRTTLRNFIGAFTTHDHPLTLFLDDLQWADSASLLLIQDLMTHPDTHALFLIGAYRDNEVGAAHPLLHTLAEMRRAKANVHEIILTALTVEHVGQLIADTVHAQVEHVLPLAHLVHKKTAGNPFFVIQFLTTLHEEHLLDFDPDSATWKWDLPRIEQKGFTDNVVDLVVRKLQRMPPTTCTILTLAACVGHSVEARILAAIHGRTADAMEADLYEAIREGFLLQAGTTYKFLHDRVQEAAYSLIPPTQRAALHLRIGRLLLAQIPTAKLTEKIFDVVSQFNRGAELIVDPQERLHVAELNLRAGKKARAATAYDSAVVFLTAGGAGLGANGWETSYQLCYDLHLERAQCEYLRGNFDAAIAQANDLLQHAKITLEKAGAYRILIALHTTRGEMERAIECGVEGLRLFGMELPLDPTRKEVERELSKVWKHLGKRHIAELIDLPVMRDPNLRMALGLLADLGTPAIFARRNLLHITLAHMVNLTMEHGTTDASVWAFTWLGATLVQRDFAQYRKGYEFGKLAYDLMERRRVSAFRAKVCLNFGDNTNFYAKHLKEDREYIHAAFRAGVENGDLPWACYSCNHIITNMLEVGDPLAEVWEESQRRLAFVRKAKDPNIADIIISQQRFIQNMRGLTEHFSTFDGEGFKEADFEARIKNSQMPLMVCWYYILKLQARFLSGDIAAALAAEKIAGDLILTSGPDIQGADYDFYAALTRAAHYAAVSPKEQNAYRAKLAAHQQLLRDLAASCPENFTNRLALVSAEIARITGHMLDAEKLYEQAIQSAHENGFVQNEALASELAARFYQERGLDLVADTYGRKAHACYVRWGADGKARQLEQQFPQILTTAAPAPVTTLALGAGQLDFLAMVKTLQSISGEILLPGLQKTLMRVVLENAGAQRGFLLLADGDQLKIHVRAEIKDRAVHVELVPAIPPSTSLLSLGVLNYVKRTGQALVLADAAADRATTDVYIARHRPRSVLCLPIKRQAELLGLLYLENNLVTGAFTTQALTVLELLAAQAAIALENANLYTALEHDIAARKQADAALRESEEKYRRIMDTAGVGICIMQANLTTDFVNAKMAEMIGYTPQEMIGAPLLSFTLPDDRPAIDKQIENRRRGLSDTYEVRFRHKNGRVIYMQASVTPILDANRHFTGSFGMFSDITARKQAEEKLQHAGAIVESSDDAIVGKDLEGKIVSWNRGAERIYGYKAEEVVGRSLSILIPSYRLNELSELMTRVQRGDKIEHYQTVRVRKDGQTIHVSVTISPIRDTTGQIVGAASIARDITRQKETENALRLASSYNRNLIEVSLDPLVTIGPDGKITDVNAATEAATGRERAKLIGTDFCNYFTEPEKARAGYQQVFREGSVHDYPLELRHCDGHVISVLYNAAVYRNDRGEVIGVFAAARDITARKQAERTLLQREAELKEAQRIARVGSWDWDATTDTITWSAEYYRICGFDPAQRPPGYEDHLKAYTPESAARLDAAVKHNLQTGEPYELDLEYAQPRGSARWITARSETKRNAQGQVVGLRGTAQDITERKQMENELRQHREHLEELVKHRTTELEQANLRLQELDRLKSMFIATMSHELRTPLNSIIGFSSILHDEWTGPVSTEQKEDLAAILRAGEHLLTLINEVIDVSKIEAGKIEPRFEDFDLHDDLLTEALRLVKKECAEKHLALICKAPPLRMHTDRHRLLQCVLNLLSNAVKFTDHGRITLETRMIPDPERQIVEIAVTDTGTGIREADQSKLFLPFVRLATPPQTIIPGTGLGLYLTKKLAVEILKGEISLQSTYGQGSRFALRIPVRLP